MMFVEIEARAAAGAADFDAANAGQMTDERPLTLDAIGAAWRPVELLEKAIGRRKVEREKED